MAAPRRTARHAARLALLPVVSFVVGYLAPHTARPDVPHHADDAHHPEH